MNILDALLQQQMQTQDGMAIPTENPQMLAAMQPHPLPAAPINPLMQGAETAIKTVRNSPIRGEGIMNKVLNSVGRALSNYGAARLRSDYHPMVRQMGSMMKTVDEQEEFDRVRNLQLMSFLAKQQAAREKLMHSQAELNEKRRYNDLRLAESRAKRLRGSGDSDKYKAIEEEIMNEHGDSVRSLDRFIDKPSSYNQAVKSIETRIRAGNAAAENIAVLNRLKELINENPSIYNSLGAILANNQKENPTPWNKFAADLTINAKNRADIGEAGKLIATLYASTLHTIPNGARLNQYLEKELKKGIPDLNMAKDAANRIFDHLAQFNEEIYDEAAKTSDYYQKGFEFKPKIRQIKKLKTSKDVSGISTNNLLNKTEDLRRKIEALKGA